MSVVDNRQKLEAVPSPRVEGCGSGVTRQGRESPAYNTCARAFVIRPTAFRHDRVDELTGASRGCPVTSGRARGDRPRQSAEPRIARTP